MCRHFDAIFRIRKALSLIEVLVVLAIALFVIGLLLPAVMSSRESARRLGCSNNLHQIGIATSSFHSSYGRLPSNLWTFADLGPFLEIKVEVRDGIRTPSMPASVVRCPSDQFANAIGASYFLNDGSSIVPKNGVVTTNDVRYAPNSALQFRDFTDGLSTTALFSEHLQLNLDDNSPLRVELTSPMRFGEREEERLFIYLENKWRTGELNSRKTMIYGATVDSFFYYGHLWSPNRPIVREVLQDLGSGNVVSPSSLHRQGISLLCADGSVRFVNDGIELSAWRALGSRNAGD